MLRYWKVHVREDVCFGQKHAGRHGFCSGYGLINPIASSQGALHVIDAPSPVPFMHHFHMLKQRSSCDLRGSMPCKMPAALQGNHQGHLRGAEGK
jgi:hypothetical protein